MRYIKNYLFTISKIPPRKNCRLTRTKTNNPKSSIQTYELYQNLLKVQIICPRSCVIQIFLVILQAKSDTKTELAENPMKNRQNTNIIMKNLLLKKRQLFLLIALLLFSGNVNSQTGAPHGGYYESVPNPYHSANQNAIENGWYEAIVQYSSNTGYTATYTLNVKVEQLCVVAILFPNGGSVHKGPNNSGYYFRGGGLYLNRDRYGNVISASTSVTVTYNDGDWQEFKIHIE